MTNFEKVKKMSVEELAKAFESTEVCAICDHIEGDCNGKCIEAAKKWLLTEEER